MSTSIAFIKKALFAVVIPIFALVKGKYINKTDSLTAFSKLMKSHLNNKHVQDFMIYECNIMT